ncbi:hypothetical protein F443_08088 [Phytophthora nicotianae P1569]|uniref:Uncharacterized protein n=1 Tax=Phytophthora nicotianae P1569 TaxID=1317065 RepID=V9F8H8_PHYNI|nr:hypothetical protein F443_08088 [Phytophthora nicotianae P1569]
MTKLSQTPKREQQNENALRTCEEEVKKGTARKKRKPRVKPEEFRFGHCHTVLRQSILKSTENELENANNFEDDISEEDAFDADDVLLSPSPNCKDSSTNSRPRSGGKKKMKQLFGRAS